MASFMCAAHLHASHWSTANLGEGDLSLFIALSRISIVNQLLCYFINDLITNECDYLM